MANRDKELAELLEKIDDIRRTDPLTSDALDLIVRLIKGEPDRKKARQTGPAKGQKYWFVQNRMTNYFTCDSDQTDFDVFRHSDIYPEERFAEAEIRAIKLIVDVNKRRRELNEGKEFGDHQCYIVFWNVSRLDFCEGSNQASAPGFAYPFGLFKNSVDCETCIHEFEDELEWFFKDYLPLMAELDDYDWADAPGWGEED